MSDDINLHKIFYHLTGKENFLSQIIEKDPEKNNKKKNIKINIMENLVTEYITLSPYEEQKYISFPSIFKKYMTSDCVRYGIKNVVEKNFNIVNISFLHSINILLRPELIKSSIEYQMQNLTLFENFIYHMIKRNFQIDKIKNTKKMQNINKNISNRLSDGIISGDIIQYIANIFEINVIVFDFIQNKMHMYWAHGIKYPTLNLFKKIFYLSCIHNNYEPIMPPNNVMTEIDKQKIYSQILSNISDFVWYKEPIISANTMLYISSWNIPFKTFYDISKFFMKKCFVVYKYNQKNMALFSRN